MRAGIVSEVPSRDGEPDDETRSTAGLGRWLRGFAANVRERGASGKPRAPLEAKSPGDPVCWHLRGRLTNSDTGRTVALVEGVELARSLHLETRGQAPGQGKPDKTGLKVDKSLQSGGWQAYGVLASNKFFVYQDPETGEPMTRFRHTKVGKKHPVKPFQWFEQAVAHVLRPDGGLLVVSEWGDRRSVKAETVNRNAVEEVGQGGRRGPLGLARWPPPAPRMVYNLQFFVRDRTGGKHDKEQEQRGGVEGGGGGGGAPRLKRWVGFGPSPPKAHSCRESYSYVSGEGASGEGGVMSYSRHGECPAWYAPGRMCSLDMQARRLGSFELLPRRLRELVLEKREAFASDLPGSLEEWRERARRKEERARESRRSRRGRLLPGSWRRRRP